MMKYVRFSLLVMLVTASAAMAQAEGGSEPQPHQAPVVEGVERPDSPAADEAAGNAEAQQPQVAPEAPDQEEQPAAESPPDVSQPAVEP